jgi:integrase
VDSENTRANYRQIVEVHLTPGLGKIRLSKLTAKQVNSFLVTKAKAGLSRSYVGRMKTLLSDALREAEAHDLVARNVATVARLPRMEAGEKRRSLTSEEDRRLIAAADGERLEALVVVGMVAGLRPGELTGLLWEDLALEGDSPTLTVSGSMKVIPSADRKRYALERGAVKKSTGGYRTVTLPQLAADALRAHRARQARERLAAGPLWTDCGLVFCSEVGGPIDPANLRRTFTRIAKRAGIDISFVYLLRHSAASLLIDNGASIQETADLLGDDVRTVLKHYRHKTQDVATAALRMQEILGSQSLAASEPS